MPLMTVHGTKPAERVRVPAGVECVWVLSQDIYRYQLRSGLFIDRCVRGPHRDPFHRYVVWAPGENPGGGALRVGGADTLDAAMEIAHRHRTYASALVVPKSQAPEGHIVYALHPGSNAYHDYWQSRDGKAFLLRHHQHATWTACHDGRVVEDVEETERRRPLCPDLVCVTFGAPTAQELAEDLERRAGLRFILDASQCWVDGELRESRPELLPAHATKRRRARSHSTSDNPTTKFA